MPSQQNIYSGRSAEFYVAYILENLGLRVSHVDLPYDDLWAAHPDGEIIRVQVKSSREPYFRKDRPNSKPRYHFKVNEARKPAYDGVYVFVALDLERMFARRWDDMPPLTIKINPDLFTPEHQDETLLREFNL